MAYPLDFSRQIDSAIHALLVHAGGFLMAFRLASTPLPAASKP